MPLLQTEMQATLLLRARFIGTQCGCFVRLLHTANIIASVVEEKLGDGREVANTDDVRSVTYIMLQQAAADAEKDMQDGASRRSWRYKPDDTEVQGQTHGGELNMPRAAAILPA